MARKILTRSKFEKRKIQRSTEERDLCKLSRDFDLNSLSVRDRKIVE